MESKINGIVLELPKKRGGGWSDYHLVVASEGIGDNDTWWVLTGWIDE
jgi:hypothetical protein